MGPATPPATQMATTLAQVQSTRALQLRPLTCVEHFSDYQFAFSAVPKLTYVWCIRGNEHSTAEQEPAESAGLQF